MQELERNLLEYLGVSHVLACNNGTIALMLALQCAGLAGKKVAVTPYTYVATLSALLWLRCVPVFVDIEPDTLCLSPELLRKRFQQEPDIAGALPVHIYGLACDVERLDAVCREYGAVLIYDAAQATTAFAASTPPKFFIRRKAAASYPTAPTPITPCRSPARSGTSTTRITAWASTAR